MLDRELTFQMPYERLTKMARSARWKAFPATRLLIWSLFAVYLALIIAFVFFDRFFADLERTYGVPGWIWPALLVVLFAIGILLLRRRSRRILKSRVDFDAPVRMRQEESGLRFATPEIEYLIKWQGISQLMMERDGVVVSHGSLLFMAPDEAFKDLNERNAFIRDVYGRLTEQAQARSKNFFRSILDTTSSTTGT